MHTPEEAGALWCPMARIARRENTEPDNSGSEVVVAGCNTDALGGIRIPASCRCVADKCAMWRWEHTTVSAPVVREAGACKYTTYEQRTVRTHGYCGLAGNPSAN